jgi:hypothetical protein
MRQTPLYATTAYDEWVLPSGGVLLSKCAEQGLGFICDAASKTTKHTNYSPFTRYNRQQLCLDHAASKAAVAVTLCRAKPSLHA